MAKAKFDFKSIEVPAAAQKPLYAGVGAGDLAVTAVKEYVADVQKTVTDFDAKALRDSAISAAKARRTAVEARVADLQAEAKSLPTKVQTTVNDNVATVIDTYGDLAKRGKAVVRGTTLPSTASVEVKVNKTKPAAKKAPVRKPATKKATKPAAKKAPASKPATKPAAKKAPAKKAAVSTPVASASASTTATPASAKA